MKPKAKKMVTPVKTIKARKKPASALMVECFWPSEAPKAKMVTIISQMTARTMMEPMESTLRKLRRVSI